MVIMERRVALYNKYGINFDFLYKEYGLRKIPVERFHIKEKDTFDYYCFKVRELRHNIQQLIDSHEDDYIARTCLSDFESMLGKKWEERISKIEDRIAYYYNKYIGVYNEVAQNEQVTKA